MCVSRMWTPENGVFEMGTSGPHVPFTYAVGAQEKIGHADNNHAETTALANLGCANLQPTFSFLSWAPQWHSE